MKLRGFACWARNNRGSVAYTSNALTERMLSWIASWLPDPRWSEAVAISAEDRPLRYADVEHRAWITAIEAYLKK